MELKGTMMVTTMLRKDGMVLIINKSLEMAKTEMFIWRRDPVSHHFISTQNIQSTDISNLSVYKKLSANSTLIFASFCNTLCSVVAWLKVISCWMLVELKYGHDMFSRFNMDHTFYRAHYDTKSVILL